MRVPKRIVHRGEAVEVDRHHGQPFGAAAFGLEALIERIAEAGPRQRAGQRVVGGEEVEPFLSASALRHVPEIEARDPRVAHVADRRRVLHNEAVVVVGAFAEHRNRQRSRFVGLAGCKCLAHGGQHVIRQHARGRCSFDRAAAIGEEHIGDLARRDDPLVAADHDYAVEIIGHDLRQRRQPRRDGRPGEPQA